MYIITCCLQSIGKAAAAGPDRDDEDEVKGQQAGNNMFKFFKLK